MSDRSKYLEGLRDYLVYRNYGKGTIKSYTRIVEKFLDFCAVNNGQYGSPQQYAYRYMVVRKQSGLAASSVNTIYSGLKLFFEHILKQSWDYDDVPRPKHLKTLPYILSTAEVAKMLGATKNAKHQTIMLLLYTCGLRVGELVVLRLQDIRFEQGLLCVRQGKGHKDRTVDLPEKVQAALRAYIAHSQPRDYLFEGRVDGEPYSVSSVRKLVKRAGKQAGLGVEVYPHLLRHAYATHHLDSGTDIVLIKQQLGHGSLQVTARYLHLCKRRPKTIQHPIDSMIVVLLLIP